jgi:PPOX class probable F420-dependent enzyme
MDQATAREAFTWQRVARLATVRGSGAPHIVPVTFGVLPVGPAGGRDVVATAIDHKPKTTRNLVRLHNIAAESRVCFLVDHYDDEWSALWWVRADADATVLDGEDPRRAPALAALAAKYPQYQEFVPTGTVIWAEVVRWSWWSAAAAQERRREPRRT